jgi:hypothetical protein
MWIQTIAIVLPRVQQHYSSKGAFLHSPIQFVDYRLFQVSDNFIGALSSSMFAGMMLGAIGEWSSHLQFKILILPCQGWGTCNNHFPSSGDRF